MGYHFYFSRNVASRSNMLGKKTFSIVRKDEPLNRNREKKEAGKGLSNVTCFILSKFNCVLTEPGNAYLFGTSDRKKDVKFVKGLTKLCALAVVY